MQCVRLYVYVCLLHERWVYVLCCVACMSLLFYIYRLVQFDTKSIDESEVIAKCGNYGRTDERTGRRTVDVINDP